MVTSETYYSYQSKTVRPKLHSELSSSPVSSLRVVSDSVSRSHSDPLWNRAVLLDLLAKNTLKLERLNSSLRKLDSVNIMGT
jgi:hypothetical protein